MNACPEFALLLHGLIDGELDAANTVRVEDHLAGCSACHAELDRLHGVRDALAMPGVRHAAPASLAAAVAAIADEEAAVPHRAARLPGWLAPGVGGAIAATLAIGLLMTSTGIDPLRPTHSAVEQEIVGSHVRSLLAGHLTDVRTSNQHVVKPWFNGKVDFAPPVPELSAAGFPLVGGRLDYIDGRVVPAVVYKRRLHTVNLFAWPKDGPRVSDGKDEGYSIVSWTDGGLRFVAVSDIGLAELGQFRDAFRSNTEAESH